MCLVAPALSQNAGEALLPLGRVGHKQLWLGALRATRGQSTKPPCVP